MLRFHPRFRLHVLHMEIAVVLRHVTNWSNVTRRDVVVRSGADGEHGAGSLHGWNLAIDVQTEIDHVAGAEQLAGYLARILPVGYDIGRRDTYVHVAWNPRQTTEPLEAEFPAADATRPTEASLD